MKLPARELTRPPVPRLDDAVVADLGFVIEIQLAELALRWKMGEAHMLWMPPVRALIIIEGGEKSPKKKASAKGKAANAYERWTDKDVEHVHTHHVDDPRGKWASHGHVRRIDYWSDKWDSGTDYTHDCTTRPGLYSLGTKKGRDRIWVVRGGGLQLTTRGLIG